MFGDPSAWRPVVLIAAGIGLALALDRWLRQERAIGYEEGTSDGFRDGAATYERGYRSYDGGADTGNQAH